MGTLSNFATTELVDHMFKAAYTPASTLYLCLCTAEPTAASTGATIVETNYTGYARASFTASSFNAASGRKIVQALDITFPEAAVAGSSNITHYAICDASSNGNMLGFGSFTSAFGVVEGNTPKVAAAEIEISIGASSGAGFVDYTAHKMLDLMFRDTAYSTPSSSLHFGLTTDVVVDADESASDYTECSGGSYERKAVPSSAIDAASNGETTNNSVITWITPTGTWGTIASVIVCDASTAGHLLAFDSSNVIDQQVNSGDTVQISVGDFDCDLD